jgi:hypothetical protein
VINHSQTQIPKYTQFPLTSSDNFLLSFFSFSVYFSLPLVFHPQLPASLYRRKVASEASYATHHAYINEEFPLLTKGKLKLMQKDNCCTSLLKIFIRYNGVAGWQLICWAQQMRATTFFFNKCPPFLTLADASKELQFFFFN